MSKTQNGTATYPITNPVEQAKLAEECLSRSVGMFEREPYRTLPNPEFETGIRKGLGHVKVLRLMVEAGEATAEQIDGGISYELKQIMDVEGCCYDARGPRATRRD